MNISDVIETKAKLSREWRTKKKENYARSKNRRKKIRKEGKAINCDDSKSHQAHVSNTTKDGDSGNGFSLMPPRITWCHNRFEPGLAQ